MKAQIFKYKTQGWCPIISGQESVIFNGMTAVLQQTTLLQHALKEIVTEISHQKSCTVHSLALSCW